MDSVWHLLTPLFRADAQLPAFVGRQGLTVQAGLFNKGIDRGAGRPSKDRQTVERGERSQVTLKCSCCLCAGLAACYSYLWKIVCVARLWLPSRGYCSIVGGVL